MTQADCSVEEMKQQALTWVISLRGWGTLALVNLMCVSCGLKKLPLTQHADHNKTHDPKVSLKALNSEQEF